MDARPNWDEYFMKIAEATAARSNCCRRHVGAVIVKDNRIISTGYNGTPRGIKNCFDGGCPRCNSNATTGEKTRSVHLFTCRRKCNRSGSLSRGSRERLKNIHDL